MAPSTTPPFRADHVGSLLRPPRAAAGPRRTTPTGAIDADELRAVEDEAIRDVVRMQEEVGLRAATDGEFRRASWHMDFIYQLGGIPRRRGQPHGEVPQRRRGRSSSRPPRSAVDGQARLERARSSATTSPTCSRR